MNGAESVHAAQDAAKACRAERSRDGGPDGGVGVKTVTVHERNRGERGQALRTYLTYLVLAAVLVGTASTIQTIVVIGRAEPHYFVVPVLLAAALGGLMGRVAVLRERLRRRNEQFHTIAELAQEFTYYRRVDGQYEYVSPSCQVLSGYTPDDFYATPRLMDRLIHPEDQERWRQHVHQVNHAGHPESLDIRIVTRTGETRWISHVCGPVYDETGRQTGVRSTNLDITQRKEFEARIEQMAYYDALTDLPNRRSLQRAVRELIEIAAAHHGRRFAVLFLDLDRFKHLNDSFGHTFGDRLLRQMAERLRQSCEGRATVTRFGGDEFVVVLPAVAESGEAVAFARELLAAVERPFLAEGRELYVSGSIGIALYPYDGEDVDTLIRHADAAMYQSKRDRRGPVRLYSPELAHNATAFVSTESRMRKALRAGEFTVFYQSKVEIESGEIVALEALARWQDPEHGLVSPIDFIPVAEETGLIRPLGEQILAQVCRQLSDWLARGVAVPVAVNISARQFADPDFCGTIERIAREAGCPLSLIELEVTEEVLLDDVPGAADKLGRLRRAGLRVALDDFGIGYSSLGYLKSLPIDRVKIDRSFIREISRNPRDQAILRAVIGLCRELDLDVISEGVETREQRDLIRSLGCRVCQGFLYCEPMPAGRMEPLLRARGERVQSDRGRPLG
jgi:diguanylate cyclase (GGDEF)-like protein/PAS domain S-box-containing protein